MSAITRFFQQGGGLSDTLSHFEPRQGQIELVAAIETAMQEKRHLIAEAGTGIGKTFSYLLPTLADNKQVFVSTATKHLQDQIFFKDLPIIEQVLGRSVSSCLLKGRANYFCHYRFDTFLGSDFKVNRKQAKKVNAIKSWSQQTLSGDISEVADFVDEDMVFRKKITSTTENCLGGECPYFDDCFVQKVREQAKKSEVVIVNHALLMADIVLKETGFAEILPEVDVVVIDEAHHLPKVATQAFAEQISSGQLNELARDALQTYRSEAGDVAGYEACIDALVGAIGDFLDALAAYQGEGQVQLGQLKQLRKPYAAFKTLMQVFKDFLSATELLAEHSKALASLFERVELTAHRIKTVFTAPSMSAPVTDACAENAENKDAIEQHLSTQSVAILEWNGDYFRASRLPIHLGNRFRDVMSYYADSWLFVSATLSVGESFDFFKDALGLPNNVETLKVDSPFDYAQNAAIHVLAHLPEPNQAHFIPALVESVVPVLKKTRGRAFMLFTAYKSLHEAADLMTNSGFTLFVQGEQPKSRLVDAFMKSDNAVLLGTVSFWEGVDVAGERLSCVVIDKIPFPSPGDPMIAEQSRYLAQHGRNAFEHCYLPKAATLLKQGAGRLIRSQKDTGILIFGDGRLIRKSYGARLLAALPPAKRVDGDELFTFIDNTLS